MCWPGAALEVPDPIVAQILWDRLLTLDPWGLTIEICDLLDGL
jgi:hypothetical protein